MSNELSALEQQARLLDPDHAARAQLLDRVIAYSQQYLDGIADAPAYAPPPDPAEFGQEATITENGVSLDHVLSLLGEHVDSRSINTTSGRYLAYIPGGGIFHAALGDYLAAVANRYAGVYFASPGAVQIENQLLRWMADEVGYPATASGNLTSGGSLANLTAIVTARDAHGLEGDLIPRSVVYLTEHAHHCIDKALRIAGLGKLIKRIVPVDAAYRMNAQALDAQIVADQQAGLKPWAIIASAGTTNTGAVDPLTEIAQIAAARKLWFHVDGAYGGLFVLCPDGKTALKGIEQSDSVVVDPHKTLFLPYGTGTVLIRDRQHQYAAFNAHADYMQNILDEDGELSPSDLSPELTKHFRGLRLWLPLKVLGVTPFRAALAEKIHLARYFHEQLQRIDGFEVGPSPDLSIVTYRYCPKRGDVDQFNQQLVKALQQDGRIFISSTVVEHKVTLRAAILSFRTHSGEIEEALRLLKHHAHALEQQA
ncbi:MAG: aminotransferase class I/II-fold pyridoxal phosphate-dependent enzyme [Anaerolineae bacterium]|nr:aminotransferase class I/II-fold pyridoxal phosphate-dependent enzyme [Anaerolineae bacterium]